MRSILKNKTLRDNHDAVLMLTWSDWKTEPRSNRYHYAKRFSLDVPVFFFQYPITNKTPKRKNLEIKPSGLDGVEIVNLNQHKTQEDIQEVIDLLNFRQIKKPLIWIYDSLNYQPLIDAFPNAIKIYHATELYLLEGKGAKAVASDSENTIAKSVIKTINQVDMVVTCSEGVSEGLKSFLRDSNTPVKIIKNGVDADFYNQMLSKNYIYDEKYFGLKQLHFVKKKVAIYQGGINYRLDLKLIFNLVNIAKDWEFKFCGSVGNIDEKLWKEVTSKPNVKYLGSLSIEELPNEIHNSSVGLIPFVQDNLIKKSFPLKAFEYIACGLPVISVPIDDLSNEPELIKFAKNAKDFKKNMDAQLQSRASIQMYKKRQQAAINNSYDSRYHSLVKFITGNNERIEKKIRKKKAVLFYDHLSTHVATIKEHLMSFDNYSNCEVFFFPGNEVFWMGKHHMNGTVQYEAKESILKYLSINDFDIAILHYSLRTSLKGHISNTLTDVLSEFRGLKIGFIQDEYEGIENTRTVMDKINFDIIYSTIPQKFINKVYPKYRYPNTDFIHTLTGYVPENSDMESFALPSEERNILIGYRGRKLPPIYGDLGQEKYNIGEHMKKICIKKGLSVDIENDAEKRIYGLDWYKFLGSCSATLGTESGANIFDFNGNIKDQIDKIQIKEKKIKYKEIHHKILKPYEGKIKMNQISPKIFEAIRLKTVLVLFEGKYSGIIKPNIHFIPLKKDFSNANEVLNKLKNKDWIEKLVNKAYKDIILSNKYSYKAFITKIDKDIDDRILTVKKINGHMKLEPLPIYDLNSDVSKFLPSRNLIQKIYHLLILLRLKQKVMIFLSRLFNFINRFSPEIIKILFFRSIDRIRKNKKIFNLIINTTRLMPGSSLIIYKFKNFYNRRKK